MNIEYGGGCIKLWLLDIDDICWSLCLWFIYVYLLKIVEVMDI